MNRSILLSILSIFAVVALVGGLTLAYFSDQGTSQNNVFNSGTLDMKLSDDNQFDLEDVTGTWGLASDPGDTFTGDLKLKNTGSVDADHVELKFNNVVTNSVSAPGSTATIPMDTVIEITELSWDHDGNGIPTVDLLAGVLDNNGNLIKDLDDLETQVADDFDDLAFGGVSQSADHVLRIAGRLHPTQTVNEHQGDSVNMDLTVVMNQNVSQ